MTVATFTKLLEINIVASRYRGFSLRFIALKDEGVFSSSNTLISFSPNEKYATSDAEIMPEHINNKIKVISKGNNEPDGSATIV